jgi:hypothetical protein
MASSNLLPCKILLGPSDLPSLRALGSFYFGDASSNA